MRTGVDMAGEDLARQVDQPSNDVVASRQIDCCDVTSMGTDVDQPGRFAEVKDSQQHRLAADHKRTAAEAGRAACVSRPTLVDPGSADLLGARAGGCAGWRRRSEIA